MSTQNINESLDKTIDSRIDTTCKILFKMEFLTSVLFLTVFLVAGFFIAVIADHWLFADGLSVTLRLSVFVTMLILSVFFVYRRIVPLFLYPINPVYAAQILENNSTSTKNAIINWITLKRERLERGRVAADKLGEKMLEGLTRSAAENINAVPTDRIVNKKGINICITLLIIIVTIMALYAMFSPKNPFQSFTRIILPFIQIEPPQAVQFHDVKPQNTTALQGEHLTISAKVIGKSKSPVYVFFSTDDGRAVKQAVPMNKLTSTGNGNNFWSRNEGERFETTFPPNKQGFICGTEYWIQQDDSKSNLYRIDVRPVATVEIESLTYKYPDYTGLAEEIVKGNGDIRAVNGTEVTVRVKSTAPLTQADIVYDKNTKSNNPANNPQKIKMKIDNDNPTIASTNISLKIDTPIDQNADKTDNADNIDNTDNTDNTNNANKIIHYFSINATDKDGFKSRRSGTFRQEVTRDKPPIVKWSDTAENLKEVAQIELPLNAALELPLDAEDPDFAIRYLRIKYKVTSGNKVNKQIRPSELLQSPITGATEHKGQIKKSANFKPTQHQLNVGDIVEVWGEVVDTKLPEPNVAETRHITIRIVKSKENNKSENQKTENKSDNKTENQKNENQKNEQTQINKTNDSKENIAKDEPDDQPKIKDETNKSQNNKSQNNSDENNSEENNNQNTQQENKSEKPNTKNNNTNENQNKAENNNGTEDENNKTNKPIDPETQSADAMQKIVDRMKKENWQPNSEQNKNDSNKKQDQDNQDQQKQNQNQNTKNQNQNNTEKASDNKDQAKSEQQDGTNNSDENGKNENNNNNNKRTDNKKGSNDKGNNENNSRNQSNQKNTNTDQQSKDNSSADKNSSNDTKPSDNSQDSANNKKENGNEKSENNTNSSDSGESTNDNGENQTENSTNSGTHKKNPDSTTDNTNSNDPLVNKTDNRKKDNSNGEKEVDQKRDNVDSDKDNKISNNDNEKNNVTKIKEQPVDEKDQTKRSRGDLDPNSNKIQNEGNNASNPKKTNLDRKNENLLQENKKNTDNIRNSKNDTEENIEREKKDSDGVNGVNRKESSNDDNNAKEKNKEKTEERNENSNKKPNEKPGNESDKSSKSSESDNDGKNKGQSNSSNNSKSDRNGNSSGNSSDKPKDNSKSGKKDGLANSSTGNGGVGGSKGAIESEAARLEFTERNVNLALDYLRDQLDKEQPSEELLKELGWTEGQLREFYKKWRAMSEKANRNDIPTKSNEAWMNALKSFNIRPTANDSKLKTNNTTFKDSTQKSQSTNLAPPKKLIQKFEQYTEGIAQ
ncbi:MAG: hypothetical protein LBC74_12460 [Planctomycetaceae bacterium]|jgi:hypothetical protein|nr:hypothetical protein [Planctomycetaceae bacterium]